MPPAPPAGPCIVAAQCRARLPLRAGVFLPVYATHRLGEGTAAEVVQAVVVLHGTSRNADAYFERMVEAARLAGRLGAAVVVAPRFQTLDDGPAADEPFWTSSGWKRGHPSEGGAAPPVSSYEALDALVLRLADKSRFPNLSRLVVAGHSAGGQVAHRYAAGSAVEETLSGYEFRYVVANPSTYLYPTEVRERAPGVFATDVPDCPGYDAWHYGLANLNPYMLESGAEAARRRLLRRDVVVLVGEEDTGTANLDQSCGANVQGANRLQRGLALVRTLTHLFPGHAHRQATVPGVGHSSRAMFQSPEGRDAVFGRQGT